MPAFMTPSLYHGRYAIIEHADGSTDYVPAAYVHDVASDDDSITYATGYLGRLSADGYMDCTDWSPLDASDDDAALVALCDMYDICPSCHEQCWDDETSECELHTTV